MITSAQYFGFKIKLPDCTLDCRNSAAILLDRVNHLLDEAFMNGSYRDDIDPDTGTQISGSRNGNGDGGFRLLSSTTGALHSAHKLGKAVDVYDPRNELDDWLTDELLAQFELYREAPTSTQGWCHMQTLAPGSGHRTFIP